MPVLALPGWLVAAILAAGLWLVARLYLAAPRRMGLAFAAAAAWILLAALLAAPRLVRVSDAWHPPRVALVVDECPGYAALGARDSADASLRAARRHYAALGFRVDALTFSSCGADADGGLHRHAGLSGLRAALRDPGAAPNLRGILLWTDGRFLETVPGEASGDVSEQVPGQVSGRSALPAAWPAPVFPVPVRPAPVASREVQGESVRVDTEGDETVVNVEWRGGGEEVGRNARRTVRAVLEWKDTAGGTARTVWRAELVSGPGARAGERHVTRLVPPAGARALVERGHGIALVRGVDDLTPRNDTVAVAARIGGRARHHLVSPLASLDERAFLDALAAAAPAQRTGAMARVVPPDSVRPRMDEVVWIRAGRPDADAVVRRARAAGAAVVRYHVNDLSSAVASPSVALPAQARPVSVEAGRAFLPEAALRLADIGLADAVDGDARLRADDGSVTPLAWAGHAGRRGLLLWRAPDGVFGTVLAPRWSVTFRSGPPAAATATAWARGVAEWIRLQGVPQAEVPARVQAGRPFHVLARLPGDTVAARLSVNGASSVGVPAGAGWLRFGISGLPPGIHPLTLHAAGAGAAADADTTPRWRGSIRVDDPAVAALARLLRDAEALRALAQASGGAVLEAGADVRAWPSLPDGQLRVAPSGATRILPVLPTTLALALLLVLVWSLRKRARLD